jgi:hypothetical protein
MCGSWTQKGMGCFDSWPLEFVEGARNNFGWEPPCLEEGGPCQFSINPGMFLTTEEKHGPVRPAEQCCSLIVASTMPPERQPRLAYWTSVHLGSPWTHSAASANFESKLSNNVLMSMKMESPNRREFAYYVRRCVIRNAKTLVLQHVQLPDMTASSRLPDEACIAHLGTHELLKAANRFWWQTTAPFKDGGKQALLPLLDVRRPGKPCVTGHPKIPWSLYPLYWLSEKTWLAWGFGCVSQSYRRAPRYLLRCW